MSKDTAKTEVVLVLITVPDREVARDLASALVERQLAAAVHISEIESVYRWQGAVHRGGEFVATVKTVAARFPDIESLVDELHPYDLPPLLQIDVARSEPRYADWIHENSAGNPVG